MEESLIASLGQRATYWRAALLLGLASGDSVVAWATSAVRGDAPAPSHLFDVSLTSPHDRVALRYALQPIANKLETDDTLRALFDRARIDLDSGARTLEDTVRVLAQLRRTFHVPLPWFDELDALEDDYMLAVTGVIGNVDASGAQVRAWLANFAGDEARLLGL